LEFEAAHIRDGFVVINGLVTQNVYRDLLPLAKGGKCFSEKYSLLPELRFNRESVGTPTLMGKIRFGIISANRAKKSSMNSNEPISVSLAQRRLNDLSRGIVGGIREFPFREDEHPSCLASPSNPRRDQ